MKKILVTYDIRKTKSHGSVTFMSPRLYKVDHKMGNDVKTPPKRYGAVRGAAAPFPVAPPLKWHLLNNSVIFQSICFKFRLKVDRRMRNEVAIPPRCYGAASGATVPFPVVPLLKRRLFNNSVIFQPIWLKFGQKVDRRMGNDVAALPHR